MKRAITKKASGEEFVLRLSAEDVVTTLRFERALMGIDLQQQARQIGVSSSALRRVISGRTRPGTAICRHLALEPLESASQACYLARIGC